MTPVLNTLDYLVITGYLAAMLALGASFARRQKSLEEYFHASGSMPWWAVAISMMATLLSPISYLSTVGWIFGRDSRYIFGGALASLAFTFLAAAIWIPLWDRLRIFSIYEFLEQRYHPTVRVVGAVLFIISTLFWLSTAVVNATMAFSAVSGLDPRLCMVGIAVLGTGYTMLGGMRAVIWTDVAQFAVFVLGYLAIGVMLLIAFDGQPMEIYRLASQQISEETGYPHTQLFSCELSLAIEATIWSVMFLHFFQAIALGSNQLHVQRMHAVGSRRGMFKALIGSSVILLLFSLVALVVAWGFVAFYENHPRLSTSIDHPDKVLPVFVVQQLPVVIRGVMMAGVMAALMSSFDSGINSMSSVLMNDLYEPYQNPGKAESHRVRVARIVTVLLGLLLLAFSLWQYEHSSETALQRLFKLSNVVTAPLPSFFLLGIFSRRVNTPGVLCGAIAGILCALALNGFPGVMDPWILQVNWMWVAGLSTIVNMAVGYAASFLFAPPIPDQLKHLTLRDAASST